MKFEQQFTQEGFSILREDDLSKFIESTELKKFQQNILSCRQQLRKFFERSDSQRLLLKSEQPKNLELTGYHPGYWPSGLFKDHYEGKKFPLEYYYSRNLYADPEAKRANFLAPENEEELNSKDIVAELPHEPSFEIAEFLERYIYQPLAAFIDSKLSFDMQPFSIIQVGSTYYRDKIVLNMHRDKAFINTIIGPASGLKIEPKNSNETIELDLELGEIFVYTGFQFQNYFAEVRDMAHIEPLVHGVVVNEDKRMSIISGTLIKV